MISYQWAAKHVLLKIRDRLKTAGYKVWMDADNMSELFNSFHNTLVSYITFV